jgi:dipeptidyl aminopeptidase/acylaminoacyl peptidase
MLASLASTEAQLLIDDATNAVYVEPGYLLYGRSGNLYAWRFDAGRRQLVGRPAPVADEKLSLWEPKNLAVFAASGSGRVVYLPEAVPKTALQWYDAGGRALGLLGSPGYHGAPRISPDGKKVAFVLSDSPQAPADVWVLDLQYERPFRLAIERPLWIPHGPAARRLAFVCQPRPPRTSAYSRSRRAGGASPDRRTEQPSGARQIRRLARTEDELRHQDPGLGASGRSQRAEHAFANAHPSCRPTAGGRGVRTRGCRSGRPPL